MCSIWLHRRISLLGQAPWGFHDDDDLKFVFAYFMWFSIFISFKKVFEKGKISNIFLIIIEKISGHIARCFVFNKSCQAGGRINFDNKK